MKAQIRGLDTEYWEWRDANPLYVWRVKKGWTLAQLAARLGMPQASLSRWEDSSGIPPPSRIVELEDLTGIKDLQTKLIEHRKRIPL